MDNYSSANLTLINQKSKEETQYILSSQEINILGRSPDCQIVLNPQEYVTVSRHHAQIQLVEKEEEFYWEISDKGTTNGTLINGAKIISSYQLKSGDRILLGLKGPEFIFTTETLNPTVLVDDSPEEIENNSVEKVEEKEDKIKEDIPQEVETKKEDTETKKIERKTTEKKSVKDKIEKTEDKVESKETLEKKEEVIKEKINLESYLTPINTLEKNLFNLVNFKEIITLDIDSKEVNTCIFNPENQLVAIALINKSIEIWKWQKKNKITTFENAHKMTINSVSFSYNSKKIVSSGSDKIVKIWDIETQAERASFSGHKMAVNSLAFSQDGKISIFDREKEIEIISLNTPNEWGELMNINQEGSLLISKSEEGIIIGQI